MHRKRPKRPIITKNYALQGFQLVIPEMFSNFVKVSFYKHSTNISNDMTKKLILAAAMLLTGSAAVAAQPKVISHRGYWTAPNSAQNSLASFTKADSVGVFGSEIDVWLTADDKLIVNHDRVYKGTDINMEKSTLKEITSIVLPNGENIPTLDAYLRLVAAKPDTRLILEMSRFRTSSARISQPKRSSRPCANTTCSTARTSSPSRSMPVLRSRS